MHQDENLPVTLNEYKQSWLFTEAFHNPSILEHDTTHIISNSRFATCSSMDITKLDEQNVIVIRKSLDKLKITLLLICLLVMTPALGLAVGFWTRKAEVGVAVSAGVFALASFLQGLAAWFHV